MASAEFRFDQVTPGLGTPNRSRHDLVPGEVITLTATTPAPGPGITYTWEILDKRGSAAVLSSTSGQVVTIGPFGDINQPSAFKVQLTVNDNGSISKSVRICSVRTLLANLRVPVFGETAPAAQTLDSNNPDLSTDNAVYTDRSGTGVTEQNPFDWTEWAWELVTQVEALSATSSETLQEAYDGGQTIVTSELGQVRIRHVTANPDGTALRVDLNAATQHLSSGRGLIELDYSPSSPQNGHVLRLIGTNMAQPMMKLESGSGLQYATVDPAGIHFRSSVVNIIADQPTVANTVGTSVLVTAGKGLGNASGGALVLQGGDTDVASLSGAGGMAVLAAGNGLGTGVAGGDLYLDGGTSASATAGVIRIGVVNASAIVSGRASNPLWKHQGSMQVVGLGTMVLGESGLGGHLQIWKSAGDPTPVANTAFLYTKDVTGVTQMWVQPGSGAAFQLAVAGGAGDVTGPGVSVDNEVVRFDGTTGKIIQSTPGFPLTLTDAGLLRGVDGLVSAPTYAFTSSATTGMYQHAVGTLGLAAAGVAAQLMGAGKWFSNFALQFSGGLGQSSVSVSVSGVGLELSGNIATDSVPAVTIDNGGHTFTENSKAQIGCYLNWELVQTGTAGFTDLEIVRLETSLGSGSQFFIRASGGAFGNTRKFSVKNTGTVQTSIGSAADPAVEIGGFTYGNVMGFCRTSNTIISVVQAGVDYFRMDVNGAFSFQQAGFSLRQDAANSPLRIGSNIGGTSTAALWVDNTLVFAGTGPQYGTFELYGLNQSGAGSFTGHQIRLGANTTGTGGAPVIGTGGAWHYEGMINGATMWSVALNGGIANTAVTPAALASGSTNNLATIGSYGYARVSGNADGTSTVTGISATNIRDGFELTIVNVGSANVAFTNLDSGSSSANQFSMLSGTRVNLGPNDQLCLKYDLTSTKWRQVSPSYSQLVPPTAGRVQLREHFFYETWKADISDGRIQHLASGTAGGFPSSGVVQLKANGVSGGRATLFATKLGLVLGDVENIGIEFRVYPIAPTTGTTTHFFGLVSTDGTKGVYIQLVHASTPTKTWTLETTNGGGTTSSSITVGAGSYYNFRLTVTEAGTKVEVSVDDGAFSTVLNGVVAPSQLVYAPVLQAKSTTGSSDGVLLVDFVDIDAVLSAEDAGSFFDDADDWVGVIKSNAGTPAAVARVGSAGSSQFEFARGDHVHDGGVVVVAGVQNADFTLTNAQEIVPIDDTSVIIDVQLPSPSLRKWLFQKVSGGTNGIRLVRAGTEKINGVAATYTLPGSTTAWDSAVPQGWMLYSDGTDWFVV